MKTNDSKLLNPTPQQVKYRNRLWAEALKKNKKKAVGDMYCNGGRCCLAVAQNVAIANGLDVPKNYHDEGMPHPKVGDFFGWGTENPWLTTPNEKYVQASKLNDKCIYSANGSTGMSHKRIAECVMNTFVHPSKKEWSF